MNSHLVTVEVGVECGTYKWMKLNRLPLNQNWFKSLNTEPVKSRSTVEHYRVLFDNLFENVPNFSALFFNHFFGAFDSGNETALFKFVVDKRLEQFQCHFFRQSALMQFKLGTDDDNRTTGVVNTFTEQVLPEPS